MKASERGFTLIELMIVVLIIGLLAAIAIWNYFVGIERSRQKKTMADIRSISQAWEARSVDMGNYSVAGWSWLPDTVTYDQLSAGLSPTYIRTVPQIDGWSRPFEFATGEPAGHAATYAIRSAGRDGSFTSTYTDSVTTSFDCDIVYGNGSFLQYPEGLQK